MDKPFPITGRLYVWDDGLFSDTIDMHNAHRKYRSGIGGCGVDVTIIPTSDYQKLMDIATTTNTKETTP